MSVPNRVLRVDLSAGRVYSERVPAAWRERYVGGKGLGARYLYEAGPGIDPMSPANPLAFFVGPLTGFLPGEPRYAAVTKSPLTGAFLDSYGGGSFASRLAGSLGGHLGVVIEGAADDPVVLSVAEGGATIASAGDLRGLGAAETDTRFPDAAVACVGPAGEAGVRYATIASDGWRPPRRPWRRGRGDGLEEPEGGRRPRPAARDAAGAPGAPGPRHRAVRGQRRRPVARSE